jgi:Zn-dependent peptidase ImmA (M78 family)/plasmid maintenance system antidote protein VapI
VPVLDDLQIVGRLLHQARLNADLSQARVAEELEVPRSAISLIESGQRSVSSIELAKLARLYGQPANAFLYSLGDALDPEPESLATSPISRYFRGALEDPAIDDRWLTREIDEFRTYADLEQAVFGRQRFELPTYPVPSGRPYEQGERLADQERRRLGLGASPIRSMIDLLEGEGVKTVYRRFPKSLEVSGAYLFSEDLGPCVLINEREDPSRRRFTAAHEYGHFLVDREAVEGEICHASKRREHFEMRANAFAAAFLLPADGVEEALLDLGAQREAVAPEDAVHLMYRFGVSFEAVLWRLVNLGWITKHQRGHWARLPVTDLTTALGYKGRRPGESEPRPDRLKKLAIEAWRAGAFESEDLADLLGIAPAALKKTIQATIPRRSRAAKAEAAEPDWL